MRWPFIIFGSIAVALGCATSAQQNSTSGVPNSPRGFDRQYQAIFKAFEEGDDGETKAKIEGFAIPQRWFVDTFGQDHGSNLAKDYNEAFQDFVSGTMGEFRSALYSRRSFPRLARITTHRGKNPGMDSTPPSLHPLPAVEQFEIRYRSGPIRDDYSPPRGAMEINQFHHELHFVAAGRDDAWIQSFVYIAGAFRFFGGAQPFWNPCGKNGPLPGGYLTKRVQPTIPVNINWREVESRFVEMRLRVQKDGAVTNIETLQGDPRLFDAAREAVGQWQYQPFSNCGQPMEKVLTVVVGFDPK